MSAVNEAKETRSRLGPPSAVSEVNVIILFPAVRKIAALIVVHVVQPPVDAKFRLAIRTVPLTETDMSLLFALPFANLKVSVRDCSDAQESGNVIAAPVALSRLA